jgi:hypothetical protein
MDATTITVTVLVVLLIVAVAALLMKINKDSKRMDALGSESLVKRMANPPIERPAVMRSAVMPPPPRMARPAVMPRRPEDNMRVGSLTLQKAKAAAEAAAKAAVIYTNPSRKVKLSAQEYFAKAQAEREASGSDFINDEERLYRPPLQSVEQALAAARAAAMKEGNRLPPSATDFDESNDAVSPVDDIENVGDQSLMLDEDPSQEYDEMAEETGIAKIAIPQPDENWIKSRQVQPVKDLSVGIAITNDVSKRDNLQTGKITSKFPIRARPAVMPPMFPHKGPQMMRPAVMPHMPPHKGPRRDMPPMLSHKGPQGKPAYFEAMRAAAAKAAQERDAKARSMVDKRARSMAENAEMQALKRIDNSGMKQYDMTKGPPQAMFGIDMGMKKTMKAEAEQAEMMAMKVEAEQARFGIDMGMGSAEEAANKAAMKAAKMQAAEAANKAVMKAATMQAEEAANKAVMKAATMQAEEAANKAAMKVEGYEMMEPRGYAIRV